MDYRHLVAGNSDGMEQSPWPLCLVVRDSCFTASWISICRSPRMLRCSMCFAGWQLPLCLRYPSLRGLDPPGIKKVETVALRLITQFVGSVDIIESLIHVALS